MKYLQLYTKLSKLPSGLKTEEVDFIDFLLLKSKSQELEIKKRIPGKAKGLIKVKDSFDDPVEGFNDYLK